MALIGFVMLYMLATIAIGLYAATRVSSTSDFALAGRSLPLPMVITATFATWFGSETILGLPGRFIESGIVGVIEEPFGSGMALILVGMFFAQPPDSKVTSLFSKPSRPISFNIFITF